MRFYHGGSNAVDPELAAAEGVSEDDKKTRREEAIKHHPLTQPSGKSLEHRDGKLMLKVPPMFWRYTQQNIGGQTFNVLDSSTQYVPWIPGSVTLSLVGIGFWVVHPGSYVDLPHEATVDIVKDAAPHLLTEAEAMSRGIAQTQASVKKPIKA